MNPSNNSWLHWQLLALIAGVYGLSFFLPAVSIPMRMGPTTWDGEVVDPGGKPLSPMRLTGAGAFRMAFQHGMAPLSRAGVAWFANPVLWLGGMLLVLRKNLMAGSAGLLAVFLILVAFAFEQLSSDEKAGHFVGYWLWCSSAVLLSVVAFGLRLRLGNTEPNSTPGAG